MAATEKHLYSGSSTGVLYTDRRDFYIKPNVVKELWTDVAPFTTVVSNQGTQNPPDPQYKMFEHENPWQKQQFQVSDATTFSAGVGQSAATGSVKDQSVVGLEGEDDTTSYAYSSWIGLECEVWDSSLTTRRGTVVITGVTGSGSSADFQAKCSSESDVTTVANDYFIVIGNAQGEGTTSPTAWADELSVVFNQCQIFKTPIQITGTVLEAALRGEKKELSRLRVQKSQEHKIQKERAFLMGSSYMGISGTFRDGALTDADGNTIRTTMGAIAALERHGASSGDNQSLFTITESTYKYSDFVDDMEKVFQYVPTVGVKRAFCGAGALSYWSKMDGTSGIAGKSSWSVKISDLKRDRLGFNFKFLETPHGVLQLIPTPVLRGPYNKYMLIVTEENLEHVIYRKPKLEVSIQPNDADYVKDQYFSDEGIAMTLVKSHQRFKIV